MKKTLLITALILILIVVGFVIYRANVIQYPNANIDKIVSDIESGSEITLYIDYKKHKIAPADGELIALLQSEKWTPCKRFLKNDAVATLYISDYAEVYFYSGGYAYINYVYEGQKGYFRITDQLFERLKALPSDNAASPADASVVESPNPSLENSPPAAELTAEQGAAAAVLTAIAKIEWMYEDLDLLPMFAENGTTDEAQYYAMRAEFLKAVRSYDGTYRKDFEIEFTFGETEADGEYILVSVRQLVSYLIIDGNGGETQLQDDIVVTLVEEGGEYKVWAIDIAFDDFDGEHKPFDFEQRFEEWTGVPYDSE